MVCVLADGCWSTESQLGEQCAEATDCVLRAREWVTDCAEHASERAGRTERDERNTASGEKANTREPKKQAGPKSKREKVWVPKPMALNAMRAKTSK